MAGGGAHCCRAGASRRGAERSVRGDFAAHGGNDENLLRHRGFARQLHRGRRRERLSGRVFADFVGYTRLQPSGRACRLRVQRHEELHGEQAGDGLLSSLVSSKPHKNNLILRF